MENFSIKTFVVPVADGENGAIEVPSREIKDFLPEIMQKLKRPIIRHFFFYDQVLTNVMVNNEPVLCASGRLNISGRYFLNVKVLDKNKLILEKLDEDMEYLKEAHLKNMADNCYAHVIVRNGGSGRSILSYTPEPGDVFINL